MKSLFQIYEMVNPNLLQGFYRYYFLKCS